MGGSPLLDARDSVLVLVDMQASLMPVIQRREEIVRHQRKLVAVARQLDIPVLVTEHYSKGLGPTAPEVASVFEEGPVGAAGLRPIEKITFSCMGEPTFRQALDDLGRMRLVLVGIETHICVCQTALEAAAAGYLVHVVPDAVGARHEDGHHFGLEKLKRHGVDLDTWEMVVYQWLRRAGTPEFKAALPHIKS